MHLRWIKVFYSLVFCAIPLHAMGQVNIQNSQVRISLSCGPNCLWEYGASQGGSTYQLAPPTFSVDGKLIYAAVRHFTSVGAPAHLDNGATEYIFAGELVRDSHLQLRVQFQVNDRTSVIRF